MTRSVLVAQGRMRAWARTILQSRRAMHTRPQAATPRARAPFVCASPVHQHRYRYRYRCWCWYQQHQNQNRHTVTSTRASSSSSSDVYALDPRVYDIAFSFRDFEAEVAFIVEVHAKFGATSAGLSSFLEVGCGPARHALLLAQSGIAQRSVGVDRSPEMVEFAKMRAKEQSLEGKTAFVVGDMAGGEDGFRGGVVGANGGGLYDAAAVMLGTFSHCLNNESAIATLRNIGACVKPEGVLVLELGNPRDVYQGSFCTDEFVNVWEIGEGGDVDFVDDKEFGEDDGDDGDDGEGGARGYTEDDPEEEDDDGGGGGGDDDDSADADELRVMVEYGREGDHFDVEQGLLDRTVGLSLFDGGELVSSTVNVVTQRQFTLQEIDLLARLSGWELRPDAVFGDFRVDVGITDDDADRMICVLTRSVV